jgi:predicted nucleotidyltransferase component of viral defense system
LLLQPDNPYFRQVQLLVRIIPEIAQETCFALKGGTAINMFVRDLPRLSVDIDLVYLPIEDRTTSLTNIKKALERIAKHTENRMRGTRAILQPNVEGLLHKILIRQQEVQVKIEVTPVLRGVVYPVEERKLAEAVQESFGFAEMQVVSFEDLFAGKMCAALDRQHPRDLFDIMLLLQNEGLTRRLHNAFLVYLLCHNRPISELLAPRFKPLSEVYTTQFRGMTSYSISLADLIQSRRQLLSEIHANLRESDRHFLISFKQGKTEWEYLSGKY